MPEETKAKKEPNKFKIYGIAILIHLLVNGLVFELLIEVLENQFETFLFPMFPYTRIALLIITIMLAKSYIDKRSSKPKKKHGWFYKITKYTSLLIIFGFLALGALFSVSEYNRSKIEPVELPALPEFEPIQR